MFQPSHGFMLAAESSRPPSKTPKARFQPPKPKRASYTIGQRLYRQSRMALYNENGKFHRPIESQAAL